MVRLQVYCYSQTKNNVGNGEPVVYVNFKYFKLGDPMRKTVWTSFGVALVLVFAICEVGYYYSGIYVDVLLRVALIFGITMGATIFASSINLIQNLEKEEPLSGNVRDTLGPDRRKD